MRTIEITIEAFNMLSEGQTHMDHVKLENTVKFDIDDEVYARLLNESPDTGDEIHDISEAVKKVCQRG